MQALVPQQRSLPPPQRLDTANWNSEETASWKPTLLGKRGPQSCGHPHTSLMVTVLSQSQGHKAGVGTGHMGPPRTSAWADPCCEHSLLSLSGVLRGRTPDPDTPVQSHQEEGRKASG